MRSPVVLAAIAALVAGGCGGDDDKGPSMQDYASQADAICRDAERKQAAIPSRGRPGLYGENFSDAAYLTRHIAVTRDALKRLTALEAPTGERKAVDAFLSAVRSNVAAIDKQIAALRARDLPGQSQANRDFQTSYGDISATAGTLGMARCQTLGN